MTIKIIEKSLFEKRQKPKGHRAYSRTTRTGKIAQIKEKPYAKKQKINISKSHYNQITKAAEDLFKKATGREPHPLELEQFFLSYEKAMRDMSKFYEKKPSDNDLNYPIIFSTSKKDFEGLRNGPMKNKFGRTHIHKNVNGIRLSAGYMGWGGVGVSFRLPPKFWRG